LHPVRRQLVVLPRRPSALLLLLAVAAWLPGWQYALHMAVNQRDNVLPADSHLGLGHWAALSAAAIATLLAALLAALRTSGSAIPAGTAVAAMLTWGITCLAYPRSAGALGSAWAALAITWAAVFGIAALFELQGSATRSSVTSSPRSLLTKCWD